MNASREFWIEGGRWARLETLVRKLALEAGLSIEILSREKAGFTETIFGKVSGDVLKIDTFTGTLRELAGREAT